MSDSLTVIFREIHRLRKHLRDLRLELDRLPISLKAYQAKVVKQEQALKDAQDGIKKHKVLINDREVSLKAANALLAKYEKQANDMTTPKEVTAKQTEIANTRTNIAQLEEEILVKMAELDARSGELPNFDALLKKAREQLASFESEMGERRTHLQNETKLAETELKTNEAKIPSLVRNTYDRIVKAHGANGLAGIKNRSCSQCNNSVSAEQVSELSMGRFECCQNCGRVLYLLD